MKYIGVLVIAAFACGDSYVDDWPWHVEDPLQMVRVPAGVARGSAPSCSSQTGDIWVQEFEIDKFPVRWDVYMFWVYGWNIWGPYIAERRPSGGPWNLVLVRHNSSLAERYCASRGLDLPTLAELERAARGSRASYEWGDQWGNYPVCADWPQVRMSMCPWTSSSGVVFPLARDTFFGELVTVPHCPGNPTIPIDLSGTRTFGPRDALTDGLIRCVRRRRAAPMSPSD